MADTKISLLDAAAALDGTEELPIVQSAVTVKTTAQDIADLAPAPAFADVTGKPTTLDGYGITDAASDAELASHEANTTSVHGIADTSTLYRSGGTDVALADGGTGASTAANARANLGLVIGTDVAPATSSLAAAASIDGSEVVPIVQTGADKTIDLQSIADLASPGGVGVREVDGSPSVTNVLTIVVPNGTLTDNGSGVVTYTPAAAGGDSTTSGAYASLPAAGNDGNLYLPTDAPYLLRDNGSTWDAFGPVNRLYVPPTTGWSWVNQNSATLDTTTGAHVLEGDGTASYSLECRARSAPATPYEITILYFWRPQYSSGAQGSAGIFWRNSTDGKLTTCWYDYRANSTAPNLYVQLMASGTSSSSIPVNLSTLQERPRWFKLVDNGTNRQIQTSMNGYDWTTIYDVTRTTHLTPDQVGFFVDGGTSTYKPKMRLVSWREA